MTVDSALLDALMRPDPKPAPRFLLHLDGASYPMENVAVADSPTPVNRPTTRGGVYFSGRSAHRITGTVLGTNLAPSLTGKMLGPSTDFEVLRIDAEIACDGRQVRLAITVHLTNSVQTPDSMELGMTIVGLESA